MRSLRSEALKREGTLAEVLVGEAQYVVLIGDVNDQMRLIAETLASLSLPPEWFDGVFCDPPYALGSDPDADDVIRYVTEGAAMPARDFMGANWSLPTPATWKRARALCKPGAWLGAYGGTQTEDLLSIGIRLGGWERRDAITLLGTSRLVWTQGQGMPKGNRIDAELDEACGAERDAVGIAHADRDPNGYDGNEFQGLVGRPPDGSRSVPQDLTSPATVLGRRFEGFGTDMAPRQEPLMLFRNPIRPVTSEQLYAATGWDHWFVVTTLRNQDRQKKFCSKWGVAHPGDDGIGRKDATDVGGEYAAQVVRFEMQERRARPLHGNAHEWRELRIRYRDGDKWAPWQALAKSKEEPFEAWSVANIAANTAAYGTGGINIDACRTFTDWSDRPDSWKRSGHSAQPDADKLAGCPPGNRIRLHGGGRWPANVVSFHSSSCCLSGTRRARTGIAKEPDGPQSMTLSGASETSLGSDVSYADADGKEIATWLCLAACSSCGDVMLCPEGGSAGECDRCGGELVWQCGYAGLNEQSYAAGVHCAGAAQGTREEWSHERGFIYGGTSGPNGMRYGDSGGAARFFPSFRAEPPPFLYAAKVSGAERDAGLDGRNPGHCLKPLTFGRWSARLFGVRGDASPGPLFLNLYGGTGSEAMAIVLEGGRVVMIEKDAEHAEIARQRISWRLEHPDGDGAIGYRVRERRAAAAKSVKQEKPKRDKATPPQLGLAFDAPQSPTVERCRSCNEEWLEDAGDECAFCGKARV